MAGSNKEGGTEAAAIVLVGKRVSSWQEQIEQEIAEGAEGTKRERKK
jgi:hypothetical protein